MAKYYKTIGEKRVEITLEEVKKIQSEYRARVAQLAQQAAHGGKPTATAKNS